MEENLLYHEAESSCANLGAHLATPRTAEENDCIAADVEGEQWARFWLGYRGGRSEESFVGADASGPITYNNWGTDEPALERDDNCAAIGETGVWYDQPCDVARFFTCQLKNSRLPECN